MNRNSKIMNKRKKFPPSSQKKNRFSDPFFEQEGGDTKRRRRRNFEDEDIESSDDEGEHLLEGEEEKEDAEEGNEVEETAAEKKKRMAYAYLEKVRSIAKRDEEDAPSGDENDREDIEGMRDSMVAKILQQEQLEESGRVRRSIASRIQKPEARDGFQLLLKHHQSVTAVALSEDDLKGFSASKDGTIVSWDVHNGKKEKYSWPSDEVLKSHGLKEPQGLASKQSKHVLALAVSTDGRYMASGGMDRHVHLWDIRTREHIRAFPGHKGPVSCLTFRQGTSELFSGSFDRSVKIWNVEDRAYINTLFGHQGDVLTIDSLRKERVLTVGRDRTMHLFKVPEESQFVFRASTSLESCCFINNDEFLSGSSDGSIEHWTIKKKKPIHTVKNAHAFRIEQSTGIQSKGGMGNDALIPEGDTSSALSWVGAVAVCRSSDLAASGAGNGLIRLWKLENDSRGISPLFEVPMTGFVNSIAFAKSGRFLVAGVGKEPRLGRWARIAGFQNGVAMHSFELK